MILLQRFVVCDETYMPVTVITAEVPAAATLLSRSMTRVFWQFNVLQPHPAKLKNSSSNARSLDKNTHSHTHDKSWRVDPSWCHTAVHNPNTLVPPCTQYGHKAVSFTSFSSITFYTVYYTISSRVQSATLLCVNLKLEYNLLPRTQFFWMQAKFQRDINRLFENDRGSRKRGIVFVVSLPFKLILMQKGYKSCWMS